MNDQMVAKYIACRNILTDEVIQANEKLGKLAQRMGRIMSKFNSVEQLKTAIIPLLAEYRQIKEGYYVAWKPYSDSLTEVLEVITSGNGVPPQWLIDETFRTNHLKYKAKTEIVDDIFNGFIEDFMDSIDYKEVKDEIENIINMPTSEPHPSMYG